MTVDDQETTRFKDVEPPPVMVQLVSAGKWRCCNRVLKSGFCPTCGAKKGEDKWSKRIDDIVANWAQEKHVADSAAATISTKIARYEQVIEDVREFTEVDDIVQLTRDMRLHLGIKPDQSADSAKRMVAGQLYRRCEDLKLQVLGLNKKSAQRGYWVETVNELLAMIPAHGR